MTPFWALDYLCLGLILASALLVVFLRSLTGSVMALSAMGTVLGSLFVVLAAPDVALAAVVVGAIAQPVLYLIAIGKLRTDVVDTGDLGETLDDPSGRSGGRGG
jgi:energy-converting hydrogenase B subunit D